MKMIRSVPAQGAETDRIMGGCSYNFESWSRNYSADGCSRGAVGDGAVR